MRTVFILAIMALVASGFYNYFVRNPLKHTTIEKDAVAVDMGEYTVKFSAVKELRESIKEYEENFANKGDRVCVALYGKTLEMQSAEVHGQNIDIKDKLQPRTYRLINSS